MNFFYHQKSPEQAKKEAQQKVADDFTEFLGRMTPEQRKQFWERHDESTRSDA